MLHVARALREQEHEATLVVPQWDASPSTPALAGEWRAEGFSWLPVASANQQPPPDHFPKDRALATARRLAGIVEVFDVAWFFERHWAMPLLRARAVSRGFTSRGCPGLRVRSGVPCEVDGGNQSHAFQPLRLPVGGLGLRWKRERSETECARAWRNCGEKGRWRPREQFGRPRRRPQSPYAFRTSKHRHFCRKC